MIDLFEGTKKILVIKLRHIGDVLLTVPAIRALKESFPGSEVTALVNSGTEEMLAGNPLVKEVIRYERSVKSLPAGRRVAEELKLVKLLRLKKFDMTVDLTGGDRPALIGFLTGATYRLGYRPRGGFKGKKLLYTHLAERPKTRTHTVLTDLGVLRAFGIDTKDLTVDIFTTKEDDSFVESALREAGYGGGLIVHAHPTSRWLFKCWPDTAMALIFDRFQDEGLTVVLTSGPDEKELGKVASIVSLMKTRPVDLSGRLKLKHLASLSKRAEFFFGVDSAPMHIAAASGARVVGIFGPSGAFDWGPWDNDEVLSTGYEGREDDGIISPYSRMIGVQTFGGNTVIQEDRDCVPCGKDGCNGSKKSDCLLSITPEAVWKILVEKHVVGPGGRTPGGR
ncbi:MAG: putative lipopolysaccharide heptosyltransferase III [Deltaproteobacteria bacterium]|nr:putative lipopolysaccharide heptosyltransferase III [Deltaproteobacteria bacterium]